MKQFSGVYGEIVMWAITDGKVFMADEDGRLAIFRTKKQAVRWAEAEINTHCKAGGLPAKTWKDANRKGLKAVNVRVVAE